MENICTRIIEHNVNNVDPLTKLIPSDLCVSMEGVFCLATCQDFCRGGPHIIERLCGRSYNLASAGITLTSIGYYDEARILARSLGEVANLVTLFVFSKQELVEWFKSSEQDRRRNFSPFKVRKKLENTGCNVVPVTNEEYSALCGDVVHPTPRTIPNAYNKLGQANVGSFHQVSGAETSIGDIRFPLMVICLGAAKMLGHNKIFKDISSEIGD